MPTDNYPPDRSSAARRSTSTTGSEPMRGNKLPQMHRLFLVDGRVLRGEIYRAPNVRLADHLTTLRGTISVTNAMDERTGERYAYIVVFTENVLFIQEIQAG